MTTIISQNELVRRAAAYVAEVRKEHPERSLHDIMDDAGMRFNLTPLDSQCLLRLFSEASQDNAIC